MGKLYEHQVKAVRNMKNGCILGGDVGTGKSRTSLAYFCVRNGGDLESDNFKMKCPKDLYIITTARKRDELDWDGELAPFLMSRYSDMSIYKHKVVVDSWNNIKKYDDTKDAFFIFDEQRLVGSGAWVKSFLKIAKFNEWIILSATPGDNWLDYIPVFIANGFYKNKTDFNRNHVIFSRYSKFPKVESYVNTGKLIKLKRSILVDMDYIRPTTRHNIDVWCEYDKEAFKKVSQRWNIFKDEPIVNAAELCYIWRRVVNTDNSRNKKVLDILNEKDRLIIFYNFNYELDILRNLDYGDDVTLAEWNGQKHEPVPKTKRWVYLVQYTAGAEGWNCIETDSIIFYSQNYSYKIMAQASGRIDRLNTEFKDLYYYHFKSKSGIDLAISRALNNKKKFNENIYAKKEKYIF